MLITYNKKRMRMTDTLSFMRQFATLINAGIPPIRSMEIMETCQSHLAHISLLHQLKHDLLAGKSLYQAFSRHPDNFTVLICQLIQVGEETGRLHEMLTRCAEYLEKQYTQKQKIQRALFYPILTTIVAMIITLGMLLFVMPHFAELFQQSSVVLPLWSRLLFNFSAFLQHHIFTMLILLFTGAILIWTLVPTKKLKQVCHAGLCRLPIINRVLEQLHLQHFFQQLAITYGAKIGLSQAIKLCHPPTSSLRLAVQRLQSDIMTGLSLSQSMRHLPEFPTFVLQLIRVGEESGKLESMLYHIAETLADEDQKRIDQLNQLLEPLIMIILGVVIGGLVIGMYLPIFNLGNTL